MTYTEDKSLAKIFHDDKPPMDLLNDFFTLTIYDDICKPLTQPCAFYSYFSCTLPFYFINDPRLLEPSHENLYTQIVTHFRNALIFPRPWHEFSKFRQTLRLTLKLLMLIGSLMIHALTFIKYCVVSPTKGTFDPTLDPRSGVQNVS